MLLESCDTSGILTDSATVSLLDGYYCGITLVSTEQTAATITVADGNGKLLSVVRAAAGIEYAIDNPTVPIVALKGIVTVLTGAGTYVVRYAPTISGLKRTS